MSLSQSARGVLCPGSALFLLDALSAMSMKEDVLRQLLDELLSSADETAPVGHGATAEELDINKQVIELVVSAGLMTLPQVTLTGSLHLLLSKT